ncbi:MAG: exopolysaccharide biosynthesis protein [Opitutae bacterium]|nr:exopolysaccharide biosynthesis protein [Opitutae bacterium]
MQKNHVKNDSAQTSEKSLKETLESILETTKSHSIQVSELFNNLGSKGFGIILVFLSLPSALPVPAPGYSTPFGIAIVLIAFQILIGKNSLKTPNSIKKITFSPNISQKILSFAISFLNKIEPFIKPRLLQFQSKQFRPFVAINLILLASLMILPIPFTNTLPAMVICLFGISICENDGLLTLISIALSLLSLAFYAFIIILIMTLGPDALTNLSNWIFDKL